MQELIKQLTSLSWWVGVVIVGVLTSLAAAYLKPRIDSILGFVSNRYRRKNEQHAKAIAKRIEALRSNPHEQIMFAILINYQRLRAINFNLCGIFFMGISPVILGASHVANATYSHILNKAASIVMCLGALAIIYATSDISGSISNHRILREARKSPTNESHESTNCNIKKEKE